MTNKGTIALGVGAVVALVAFARRPRLLAIAPGEPEPTPSVETSWEWTMPGSTASYSNKVQAFARAIATAEGFYVANSLPQRAHNPGNLVVPNWTGQKMGREGISVFESDAEGWARLYRQLQLIIDGRSSVYFINRDTIRTMGAKWTSKIDTSEAGPWATNVARVLGVSVDTPLRDVLA